MIVLLAEEISFDASNVSVESEKDYKDHGIILL